MFFRREKYIISHFEGFFEGAETFFMSKLSRAKGHFYEKRLYTRRCIQYEGMSKILLF
jgi:hypothetical protein